MAVFEKFLHHSCMFAFCVVVVLDSLPVGVLGAAAAADGELQKLSVALANLKNALEPLKPQQGIWWDAASKKYIVSSRELEKLESETGAAMLVAKNAWGALQTQVEALNDA
eukprot:866247_1